MISCNQIGRLQNWNPNIIIQFPESVNEKVDGYAEQMTAPMAIHFRRFFGDDSGLDFTKITNTDIRGFFTDRYSTVEEFLKKNFDEYGN